MIRLYSGTPGSGKSLHTASVIWTRLRNGRNIIANFPINEEPVRESRLTYLCRRLGIKYQGKPKRIGKYIYRDMSELSTEYLIEYAQKNHVKGKEGQTLVIIDECAVLFNSRSWDAKDRMKWIVFFQQHRKLGFNVILVAQQDRMIDRQIRGFVEYECKHRCINNYKLFGAILGFLCMGKLFVAIEYWYGMRERIGAEWFRLNKRVASVYDTFMIFSKDGTGMAEGGRGGAALGESSAGPEPAVADDACRDDAAAASLLPQTAQV